MSKKSKKEPSVPSHNDPQLDDANGSPTEVLPIHTVATLKDLRKSSHCTQDGLAATMGMKQGTISRIEKRDDMLVSTLQQYVEGIGGTLQLLVTFPDRPALIVEQLGKKMASISKTGKKKPGRSGTPIL